MDKTAASCVTSSNKTQQRLQRTLSIFDALPDTALIDVLVVGAIRGRSRTSTWRDVKEGRLPPPIKVGRRSARWPVGVIRQSVKGGA